MNKNSWRARFIVFEGLDGSGQSTEAKLLKRYFEEQGRQVVLTKEPTKESAVGKIIEQVLEEKQKVNPLELQKLFAKDRRWHLENIVKPALKQGKIVISDRYYFSSFAYGSSAGVEFNQLYELNKEFLLPDIVFFLDAKPETCIKRIENRGEEKTLFEKLAKLKQVYKNYKEVLEDFKSKTNVYFIDGEKSINEVYEQVRYIMQHRQVPGF